MRERTLPDRIEIALSGGESLTTTELARELDVNGKALTGHLGAMRKAGILHRTTNRAGSFSYSLASAPSAERPHAPAAPVSPGKADGGRAVWDEDEDLDDSPIGTTPADEVAANGAWGRDLHDDIAEAIGIATDGTDDELIAAVVRLVEERNATGIDLAATRERADLNERRLEDARNDLARVRDQLTDAAAQVNRLGTLAGPWESGGVRFDRRRGWGRDAIHLTAKGGGTPYVAVVADPHEAGFVERATVCGRTAPEAMALADLVARQLGWSLTGLVRDMTDSAATVPQEAEIDIPF